ncbi:MAG: hypothetical protein N3A56_04600, partial [Thermodesulfobacteriaceae bacterium]|nr:hypothetical protein [Thermodesulfobacteriaceae bacterium]
GILLHAWYLSFPHPLSKEKMEFWINQPSYFPSFALDKTLIWDFLYRIRRFQREKLYVPS